MLGAWLRVDPQQAGFYSTYFLVPKWDGGLTPHSSISGAEIFHQKSEMLTIPRVSHAVNKGEWVGIINLRMPIARFLCGTVTGGSQGLGSRAGKLEFCVLQSN